WSLRYSRNAYILGCKIMGSRRAYTTENINGALLYSKNEQKKGYWNHSRCDGHILTRTRVGSKISASLPFFPTCICLVDSPKRSRSPKRHHHGYLREK
ncbi:hypothetical protein KI387_009125, partial [Taxus chinensis]